MITMPNDQVIKRNQMMVLQALAEKEAALLLYNDPQEQAERKELIEAQDHIHHPRGRLVYHMELVGLLSQCCTGKNAQGEMLVRELLPLSDLVQQCLLPELTPALRANYMLLLDEAYLDTDKHQKEVPTGRVSDSVAQGPTALTSPLPPSTQVATSEDVRQLLLVLRQRVASFVEDLQDPEKCNFAEEDEESEEMLQQANTPLILPHIHRAPRLTRHTTPPLHRPSSCTAR